uniref:C2 domain-containing protein n=1 Tax=Solanum lycopersicum TaxID=4081 RepID=A0A3Q7IZB8_SOLLC
MSDKGFSQIGYHRPRPWDEDDLRTFRGKSHINDNKNSGENEYMINLFIRRASNVLPILEGTFPCFSRGIYRVIVSDESGREFSTRRIVGRPEPTWNELIQIHISSYPISQKLKLKVVHENCYRDPGTSTGEAVVGRAIIHVHEKLEKCFEKVGFVELVKLVGLEKRVEAVLSFEIFLTTIMIE